MTKKKSQSEETPLTPWQEEHARYLQKKNEEEKGQPDDQVSVADEKKETSDSYDDEDIQLDRASERVSFMEKLPNLHSYHNKQLIRRVSVILGLLTIPLIICGYFISPYSRLGKIEVSGNQVVTTQEIIAASKLQLDENFWQQYQDRSQAAKKIETKYPRIKSVAIKMTGINQLKLSVTEYEEIAQLSKNGTYSPILASGKVLAETRKEANKQEVILEKFMNNEQILATITQYKKLSSELQSAISQISYEATKANDQLLHLYMNDGNTVIVNIDNLASQMKYYPQIAKDLTEKGTIDMEVGIFYAPYESSTTSTSDTTNKSDTTSSSEESVPSDSSQENN